MLHLQKYLHENGIEKTVKDFALKVKVYDHKVLLKYSMIESPFYRPEVREARGIILERDSWNFISMNFYKFFNLGESHYADIDWNTARIYKKYDGSVMSLYFDPILQDWRVATSGTAEAETPVGDTTKFDSFAKLFWYTFGQYTDLNKLDTNNIYVFELMTPHNIIVTPHTDYQLRLLTVRDRNSVFSDYPNTVRMGEYNHPYIENHISPQIGIPFAESYDLSNLDEVQDTLNNMPFDEEGYVVMDGKFDRVKIKNPSYVRVHHAIDMSKRRLLDVIRNGEYDEVISVIEHNGFKEKVNTVKAAYDELYREIDVGFNRMIEEFSEEHNYSLNDLDKTIVNSSSLRKKFAQKLKASDYGWNGYVWAKLTGKKSNVGEYLKDIHLDKLLKNLNL